MAALGRDAFMLAPGLGTGYTVAAPMVAKLLLSPPTTRLLLQGLRLPVHARAARATWAAQLGRALDGPAAAVQAVVQQDAQAAAP